VDNWQTESVDPGSGASEIEESQLAGFKSKRAKSKAGRRPQKHKLLEEILEQFADDSSDPD
jgi:hypothetical protein